MVDTPFDPGNKYSVCKDWGSTGYVYDTTVIKRELKSWADFLDAAQKEASGSLSLLEDQSEVAFTYFYANGIDENTTDPAHIAAYRSFIIDKIAPHVQAFESSTNASISSSARTLIHCWNGDARLGILANAEPDRYKWVWPSEGANLWQDNWAIVKGAPHEDAAYEFINYVLDPVVSLKELTLHRIQHRDQGNRGCGQEGRHQAARLGLHQRRHHEEAGLQPDDVRRGHHHRHLRRAQGRGGQVTALEEHPAPMPSAAGAQPSRRRLRLPGGLGALPISVWILLFFILPFGLVVWYSFGYKPDIYTTHANDILSFDRYGQAASPAFFAIFVRTLKIAVVGTVLCLVIAFPMAYWMAVKLAPKWRGVVLALVLIPYWTNFLVRTIGWQISLSPEGFVSKVLQLGQSDRRPATRALHLGCGSARRGLQLSAADDPSAVRGAGASRPETARGQSRPRRHGVGHAVAHHRFRWPRRA